MAWLKGTWGPYSSVTMSYEHSIKEEKHMTIDTFIEILARETQARNWQWYLTQEDGWNGGGKIRRMLASGNTRCPIESVGDPDGSGPVSWAAQAMNLGLTGNDRLRIVHASDNTLSEKGRPDIQELRRRLLKACGIPEKKEEVKADDRAAKMKVTNGIAAVINAFNALDLITKEVDTASSDMSKWINTGYPTRFGSLKDIMNAMARWQDDILKSIAPKEEREKAAVEDVLRMVDEAFEMDALMKGTVTRQRLLDAVTKLKDIRNEK